MGKKSAPTQTTSTVTQTNLPEYAKPYFERMMARAESETNQPYIQYGGPRIAGFSDDQLAAQQGYRDFGTDPLSDAMGVAGGATAGLGGIGGYQNQNVYTDDWSSDDASRYMNPFLSTVFDQQRDAAFKTFQEGAGQRDAEAVRAGAFGSTRQGVADYMAQRDMMSELNAMQANALRDSYDRGLGAYQGDQGRLLEALMANQQAGLSSAGLNQEGVLARTNAMIQQGQLMGQLGESNRNLNQMRLENLYRTGADQQAINQASLDTAYQDFINQRDYDRQNLQFMSGILHGVPVSSESNVIGYQAAPSGVSQLAGLGLTANALSGIMGGGKG